MGSTPANGWVVVDQSKTGTIDSIIGPLGQDEAYQLKERLVKTQMDREADGANLFDPDSIHVFEIVNPETVDESTFYAD